MGEVVVEGLFGVGDKITQFYFLGNCEFQVLFHSARGDLEGRFSKLTAICVETLAHSLHNALHCLTHFEHDDITLKNLIEILAPNSIFFIDMQVKGLEQDFTSGSSKEQ